MLYQNLLKNHSFSTFVLPQTTEQDDMIHDIDVEVHHEKIIVQKTTIHKIGTALQLKIDLVMLKILLHHKTLDHDMTIINENPDLIALRIDPLTDHLLDMTLSTFIDHVHIQETKTISQDTHLPLDHLHDPEILNFLDLTHTQSKIITIQPHTPQDPLNFDVHMYHPTEMANAVAPTRWFYSLYIHTSSN